MVGVTRNRGNLVLTLGPVPSCPPGPTRAVVDFSDGRQELHVAGLLTPAADGGAELVVESAPAKRPSRSARLAPPADVAFAICLVEVEGGGRQCYPILDIGVRGLRIETSTPLALGTVLGDLIVLYRREVLRSGEGVVTSCSPVFYPDGRLVYECGVRHRSTGRRRTEASIGDRVDRAERAEIDDISRVRAILWALCDLGYEVAVSGPTGVVKGRMLQHGLIDRSRVPELRCRVEDADRLPLRSGAVTVECSLFGSGYRFYARITDRKGDVLTLSPSPKLREWHRRGEERTPLAPQSGAVISYRHPLTGTRRAHPLIDLSSHGFSFPPGASDEELWAGLPLKDVRIQLGAVAFKPPEVAIRSVSPSRVSAEMRALPDREADLMREQLIEHGPDPIRFHDGGRLDDLVAFYRSKNLLDARNGVEHDRGVRRIEADLEDRPRSIGWAHAHRDGPLARGDRRGADVGPRLRAHLDLSAQRSGVRPGARRGGPAPRHPHASGRSPQRRRVRRGNRSARGREECTDW